MEQTAHPRPSEQVVQQVEPHAVGVMKVVSAVADEHVRLVGTLGHGVACGNMSRWRCAQKRSITATRCSSEIFLCPAHHRAKSHAPRHKQYHPLGAVLTPYEARHAVCGKRPQAGFVAQNEMPQSVTLEQYILKLVVNQLGRGVVVRIDFFDDNRHLLINLFLGEGGMKHDVSQKLHRPLYIRCRDGGMHHRFLLRCEGVEVATDML